MSALDEVKEVSEARRLMTAAADALDKLVIGLRGPGVVHVEAQDACDALLALYEHVKELGLHILHKDAPKALLSLPELGARAGEVIGEDAIADLEKQAARLRVSAAFAEQLARPAIQALLA